MKSNRCVSPLALSLLLFSWAGLCAASPQLLERARTLLQQSNAKQAYVELVAEQARLTGQEEYDYLLGVAALDSNRVEDAIIAFERVLAVNPRNAGAQLDLARAYYAAGSFELSEAAFVQLRDNSPPAVALATIERYLDAIRKRRSQVRPGIGGYVDLSIGRDSNLTGVPNNFTQAVFNSFQIPDIEPTGNSIKRRASYFNVSGGLEYGHPLGRGLGAFAAADVRARNYLNQADFNLREGTLRGGLTLNEGQAQWRLTGMGQRFDQEGAAPGEPKATNDRESFAGALDWRYMLDPRTQVGAGLQVARVRFPRNTAEDFNQVLASVSFLKSFQTTYSPLFYVTAFASDDDAVRTLPDGVTDKGKQVLGARAYTQLAVGERWSAFGQLGLTGRRDKSDFARANSVRRGKDHLAEATLGVLWRFRPLCQMRTQVALSRNDSNIEIYDYNRGELSTAVRCEMN